MFAREYIHRHHEGLRWATVLLLAALVALLLATVATGVVPDKPDEGPVITFVVSPSFGVFRGAEYPGATPFVSVGTEVEPNTVVGVIESAYSQSYEMVVRAGVKGTIVEVLATDGEMVTLGQPLFKVECQMPPKTD
jgi:acetyl-CoA carboxylase biotin carboxyl carrier protein